MPPQLPYNRIPPCVGIFIYLMLSLLTLITLLTYVMLRHALGFLEDSQSDFYLLDEFLNK